LEGKQERRREIKGEEEDQWDTGSKVEPTGGTETDIATTTSVAEKVRNATLVGDNRTHSDGGSREDECGDGKASAARSRVFSKESIYHGCGQKDK